MLAIERRKEILAKLQQNKRVLVNDLSKTYDVTEETIRRDLEKLEKEGLVKKTYGGAILNESLNVDLPYNIRKKTNVSNKQYIAEILSSIIEDGDHIMMDASSTAVYTAKYIKNKKDITLITNSVEILLDLSDITGWKIISTGGILKEGSLSLVGYQAQKMLQSFHVDKTIISCKGIDIQNGFTDSNEADIQIKNLMLKAANQKILAADSSKFDKTSFIQVSDFNDIDIIVTDTKPNQEWLQKFNSLNIKIYYNKQG